MPHTTMCPPIPPGVEPTSVHTDATTQCVKFADVPKGHIDYGCTVSPWASRKVYPEPLQRREIVPNLVTEKPVANRSHYGRAQRTSIPIWP